MTLRLALIADDLSGALDTATPFAIAGLPTIVALGPEGIGEALSAGAAVVAVVTATRAVGPSLAAARTAEVAARLMDARPEILFKKVDSRLKGNPGAESHALAAVAGRQRLVVAPAVPDQMRVTVAGRIAGRGVTEPIPVAGYFANSRRPVDVADAATDADLDRVVAQHDWAGAVAVGARGLGLAFARRLGRSLPMRRWRTDGNVLFAVGSRDPITEAQVAALIATGRLRTVVDAPAGAIAPTDAIALPALVHCSGAVDERPDLVAQRFGVGVAGLVRDLAPSGLMLTGGDTALAALRALGLRCIRPQGEVEAGVPWFEATTADCASLLCSVKSGGFGDAGTLARLAAAETGRAETKAAS